jgi:hypothetical protein
MNSEISPAVLPTGQGAKEATRALPRPGSPEASAMMDSLLAEYQWPANSKNAARAGWEAANRWLAASPQEGAVQADAMDAANANGLAWAVHRWMAEVSNRPIVNVHRRSLDDVWRQVVRYFGGDPAKLLGPSHDELRSAMTNKEYAGLAATPKDLPAQEGLSDKKRLDWLQERSETVYRCTHQERRPTTDTYRHYETVQVFDGWAVLGDQEPKPTIREAIDAAIESAVRREGE